MFVYTNDLFIFHTHYAHKPSITVVFCTLFFRLRCQKKRWLLTIRFSVAFFTPFHFVSLVFVSDISATNKKHLSPDDLRSVSFKLLCHFFLPFFRLSLFLLFTSRQLNKMERTQLCVFVAKISTYESNWVEWSGVGWFTYGFTAYVVIVHFDIDSKSKWTKSTVKKKFNTKMSYSMFFSAFIKLHSHFYLFFWFSTFPISFFSR